MYEIVLLEKAISELYKLPKREADKIVGRIDKFRKTLTQKGVKSCKVMMRFIGLDREIIEYCMRCEKSN